MCPLLHLRGQSYLLLSEMGNLKTVSLCQEQYELKIPLPSIIHEILSSVVHCFFISAPGAAPPDWMSFILATWWSTKLALPASTANPILAVSPYPLVLLPHTCALQPPLLALANQKLENPTVYQNPTANWVTRTNFQLTWIQTDTHIIHSDLRLFKKIFW